MALRDQTYCVLCVALIDNVSIKLGSTAARVMCWKRSLRDVLCDDPPLPFVDSADAKVHERNCGNFNRLEISCRFCLDIVVYGE